MTLKAVQRWNTKIKQKRNMESFFTTGISSCSPSERTFYGDELLPKLPVPRLDATIKKYLDSCRAIVSPDQFSNTVAIAEWFCRKEGVQLQTQLTARAKVKKNWLEEWWLNSYLDYRGPLGCLNFFGGSQLEAWPPEKGSQLKRSSVQLHIIMRFWKLLREERLAQHKDSKGTAFSMSQFRNLFNTTRIPQHGRDCVQRGFKTADEGYSPTHLIIFYRRRMYKIQAVDEESGEVYTPSQFFHMLSDITTNKTYGAGVGALTELDRETWCDARAHLRSLSPENANNLRDVENALMCFSLSELHIEDDSSWIRLGAFDSVANRWADKSFNYHASEDGRFICYNDHTPFDGMVFVTLMSYTEACLSDMKEKLDDAWKLEKEPEPVTEICFTLDERLHGLIGKGTELVDKLNRDTDIHLQHCRNFGKKELKALKIHPVALVQLCLQLAYMRKHGKPAATFYNGRTETVRTCTPESVAFCKAMLEDSKPENKKLLFKKAYEKYIWQMEECKAARGCDRHLFGLAAIAKENGECLPELFTDPAYEKSGGNGNFVLSTSFTGYDMSIGAVVPMRNDGYGTFYRVNNRGISIAITAWNTCEETDAPSMGQAIQGALDDVYVLLSGPNAKL